jgi:hypothetical protein
VEGLVTSTAGDAARLNAWSDPVFKLPLHYHFWTQIQPGSFWSYSRDSGFSHSLVPAVSTPEDTSRTYGRYVPPKTPRWDLRTTTRRNAVKHKVV